MFAEQVVTSRTDHSWDIEAEEADEDEAEPVRWLPRILVVALLAAGGSGAAFIVHASGGSLQSLAPQAVTPKGAAVAEKPAAQAELDALRQQINTLNQSNQQLLAAQQAEIKRLTEQVGTLSGKLELLQRPVTSAQAAIAPVKPGIPMPVAKKDAAKPVAAAKPVPKPVDTRPTGAISTGGAPLPLTR
jgi:hypothetical protein